MQIVRGPEADSLGALVPLMPLHANTTAYSEPLRRRRRWSAPQIHHGPTVRQREQRWMALRAGADAATCALAALIAWQAAPVGVSDESAWAAPVFAVLTLLLLAMRGLYTPRLRIVLLDELRSATASTSFAAMATITLLVASTHSPGIGRFGVIVWLLGTAGLVISRSATALMVTHARRGGAASARTLMIGAGHVGRLAAARLLAEPELGLLPVGFLDKEPLEDDGPTAGLPVFGASWDLEQVVEEQGIEHVVIGFSTAPHHVLLSLVRRCWELGVAVSIVPRLFEVEGERARSDYLGGLPLISLNPSAPRSWKLTVKYATDRLLALLVLLVLAPLLVAITLAVRITMGRPIFYRQLRVGRDGRAFEMLKFRTMTGRPEAAGENDAAWAAAATGEPGAVVAKLPERDRRTPVGSFLRKFSLDELPQFINVLRGDMSLIGPRPERVNYVSRFERSVYRYGERHRIKPGITGWAQVNGLRGSTSLADRIEWDNHYVENWSPWLDFKIAMKTVACVLKPHGE